MFRRFPTSLKHVLFMFPLNEKVKWTETLNTTAGSLQHRHCDVAADQITTSNKICYKWDIKTHLLSASQAKWLIYRDKASCLQGKIKAKRDKRSAFIEPSLIIILLTFMSLRYDVLSVVSQLKKSLSMWLLQLRLDGYRFVCLQN